MYEIVGVKYTQDLPPFHKQNGHNDAYIYFSTIAYLQKNNIDTFVFITRNIKDFGDAENLNENIHPGLLIQGIDVQYFLPVALAVNKLQKESGIDHTILLEFEGG